MAEYNWSDLDVGDRNLNHSEGYFGQKHSKHEKYYKDLLVDDKENIKIKKENADPSNAGQTEPTKKQIKKDPLEKKLTHIKTEPKNLLKTAIEKNAKSKFIQQPPSAYRYKEIYENKKKLMFNKLMQDEKKMREFHSRPVPNFKRSNEPEIRSIAVTVPITPCVLKKSREFGEIRRRKLQELNRQNQPQKICAREAKVLHEEPFIPKILPRYVQPEPFNLSVEKRLEERKQYDKNYNEKIEEKKKQLEEEQRIHEENLNKEFRKLATFKANRNPNK